MCGGGHLKKLEKSWKKLEKNGQNLEKIGKNLKRIDQNWSKVCPGGGKAPPPRPPPKSIPANVGAFDPSVPQPPNLTSLRNLQHTSAGTYLAHATSSTSKSQYTYE